MAPPTWKTMMRDLLITGAITLLVLFGARFFVDRVTVYGSSMSPTLNAGDYLLVWKTRGMLPDRGSVVVCEGADSREMIKRVIGIPGDKISAVEDKMFINGQLLNEPYAHGAQSSLTKEWEVPDSGVFVVGDNRISSYDSRDWGSLQVERITGIAFFRYWPFDDFGVVR